MKKFVFCSGYTVPTLFWNQQKMSWMGRERGFIQTCYQLWSMVRYYNLTTPYWESSPNLPSRDEQQFRNSVYKLFDVVQTYAFISFNISKQELQGIWCRSILTKDILKSLRPKYTNFFNNLEAGITKTWKLIKT